MRMAISGSHRVGKTTLAEALAHALPHHEVVPEPYHLLEEDGHEFAEMPSIEDFELQLERSIQSVHDSGPDVVFDRCSLDILGYLLTHQDADVFQLEEWMPRIEESIAALDMIVFVPIEAPDRMPVSRSDAPLRAEIDAVLRDIILDDEYGLGFEVLMVTGTLEARQSQVSASLR